MNFAAMLVSKYCLMFVNIQGPVGFQPRAVFCGCKEGGPVTASRIAVYMDGLEVVQEDPSTDVSLAVSCVMATYFVYSICYPKKLRNSLLFLEKYLFKLMSNDRVPVTVQQAYDILR